MEAFKLLADAIAASRARARLESLQEQLTGLREENMNLRSVIRENIPNKAGEILQQSMTEESFLLMDSDLKLAAKETGNKQHGRAAGNGGADGAMTNRAQLPDGVVGKGRNSVLTEPDYRLMISLLTAQQNFTVSDPSLPDNPIVYASEGFLKLTGYTRDQVLGRNCRFLQGPETSVESVTRTVS